MKSEKEILSEMRRGLEFLKALAVFDQEPIQYQSIREEARSALSILDSSEDLGYLHQRLIWIFRSANQLEGTPQNREIQSIATALYKDFEILEVFHEI